MAVSALPETLKAITATKFEELTKQQDAFETAKAKIYADASSAKDPITAAQALLDGTKRLKNVHLVDDEGSDEDEYGSTGTIASELQNKGQLLRQATVDPSVPSSLVSDIHKSLKQDLEFESTRRQHAHFFSALVTEWLSCPDKEDQASEASAFEQVGREEMHEQRATWESLVFKEGNVDSAGIISYLEELFTTETAARLAYEDIVRSTRNFSAKLYDNKQLFDSDQLQTTMKGLLKSDLLSEQKNATLKTFLSNEEVLKEVADVLNMRFTSLSTWNWTLSGKAIPVEMRRQLNGKYRVFMDEDILDAVLLFEIGLLWSIHFKRVFSEFLGSFAWKISEKAIPQKDLQRRLYFLGPQDTNRTVQSSRRINYSSDYFLTQLPSSRDIGQRSYDGDNTNDWDDPGVKGALELKHNLLQILVTESLIAKDSRPDQTHTVVRSDFKWFGPGLPHETIFTVLKFFGVSNVWLEFFKKFLEVPISFRQDGPSASVQVRTRGIPLSHTISDVMGEVVLFVMDHAVSQATSSYLYRLHDDFWLWGPEETCLKGWQTMTKFASILGIEFNKEKTGTVRFGKSPSSNLSTKEQDDDESAYGVHTTALPAGEVRWGFLRLDESSGRFLVDQSLVDLHVTELKTQLSCCKSVLSYIQAYNAYAGRFFTNNFGKPCNAFGRNHIDMMIATFRRIQQSLFPDGSVTDYLDGLVAQRFLIKDLPQGVWYFPVEKGGLELLNPLVSLLVLQSSMRSSPARLLQKAKDAEEASYYRAKAHFEAKGGAYGLGAPDSDIVRAIQAAKQSFMSKEEYLQYREETSIELRNLYDKLLSSPPAQEIQCTPRLSSILSQSDPELPARGKDIVSEFDTMSAYWKWMVALYGEDIVRRYGSVRIVDAGQIPLGVVKLLKSGKVRWQG